MKPVDPKFVDSLMENIYGNDEDMIKHQSCEEAEKAVEKHASTMENFGLPTNIGNVWKAPKDPQPRKQKLEDHKDEDKSLTESVDPMEERIANLEEGLVTILETLKSFVTNIDESKKKDKFVKHERTNEKPRVPPTHVMIKGKRVPLANLKKNLGNTQYQEKVRLANAQALEADPATATKVHGGQSMSKSEISQIVKDDN
jgi:hypothetical protein